MGFLPRFRGGYLRHNAISSSYPAGTMVWVIPLCDGLRRTIGFTVDHHFHRRRPDRSASPSSTISATVSLTVGFTIDHNFRDLRPDRLASPLSTISITVGLTLGFTVDHHFHHRRPDRSASPLGIISTIVQRLSWSHLAFRSKEETQDDRWVDRPVEASCMAHLQPRGLKDRRMSSISVGFNYPGHGNRTVSLTTSKAAVGSGVGPTEGVSAIPRIQPSHAGGG